ncbi:probable protein arginine N-methyltransferase [Plasmodium cynomolgi strain B]|uniref:type I protein arginine methyltransferase n=1 Tax=Plasmodium cynomolgi (strain B) TaxID=1120755 RepID=K6UMB0_PLACD|nr:probable protein arginine N-methyltransferase [Plasmodium cynomolgi strain B]GAB68448.1 probable protein arginine N-methyltransferase [Plasmodium cynomolgi strain B]
MNQGKFEMREGVYNEKGGGKGNNWEKEPKGFNAEELQNFFSTWRKFYKEKTNELGERKNFLVFDKEKDLDSGNTEYFNSYNYIHIHEDMIKDEVRTRTYYDAIRKNEHLIKDKIVLDVGCGTGILSFFAAMSGAKHVYSIEKSNIIYTAVKIRDENNLTDKITFLKGLAEEIELPVDKVDIIISEWMGYCLLYENMLDTVLYCRDKWLREGGLLFPDKAYMYMAGIEDSLYREEKFDFWRNCYDLNYTSVLPILKEEVVIDYVDKNFIISFTTGPYGGHTHWKQIVLYTDHVLTVEKHEVLRGMFALRKNAKNKRHIDMKLHYVFEGAHTRARATQFFNIS